MWNLNSIKRTYLFRNFDNDNHNADREVYKNITMHKNQLYGLPQTCTGIRKTNEWLAKANPT